MKYIAPEDAHVYSIDEIFLDVTHYLETYSMPPRQLAEKIIRDVYQETGITATAGIGSNLYLSKIAMDIVAKHIQPDENGVRIAELDERSYRQLLWNHRPITDFWRVGKGYAKKLKEHGMFTMEMLQDAPSENRMTITMRSFCTGCLGSMQSCSLTMPGDGSLVPWRILKHTGRRENSIGSGQVLPCPYSTQKARLVVQEMTDLLMLDLVDKGLVTDQMVLTVGYDIENLSQETGRGAYEGTVTTDRYGRKIPKHAHGTVNLQKFSSSTSQITEAVLKLFDNIVNPNLLVRRLQLTANHVSEEKKEKQEPVWEQMDLFTDYAALEKQKQEEDAMLERERKLQEAMLDIKKKFGKNAILKGMNLGKGSHNQRQKSADWRA